jgi:hypothetical protein
VFFFVDIISASPKGDTEKRKMGVKTMYRIKGPFWASKKATVILKRDGVNHKNGPVDIFRVDKITGESLFDDVHLPNDLAGDFFVVSTVWGWHGIVRLSSEIEYP